MDVLRMLNPKFGTLLTAAELGSFTRAAAALNFTQPAVSHQISQLEQQLGVTLFVRAKGKISLTPEGEIVVQYVRRMKALEQQLLDDLQSADRRLTRLRVGITHTAESNLITEVLAKFGQENDGVSITITTDTIKNLYDAMEHFELDLAVVDSTVPSADLNALLLDTDCIMCVLSVLRFFTKLKGKLMPYLFAQAVKTHATGIPMMRPMVMDYTDDIACRYLDQQYMLGDSLLCAPVFREDGVANFYLPEGKWYDIITGKTYEGGKYHAVTCTFMEMPVLAKPNSIVTFGAFENQFEYDYLEGADAMICNLEDGKTAEASIYDTKANLVLTIQATRKGNVISVETSSTDKTFTVSVAGTDKKITLQGGKGEIVL